jgi:hypothetical protein
MRVTTARAMALLFAAGACLAGSLGDPTQPYTEYRASAAHVVASINVSAVISSSTRRIAIVNGIVAQAGTRVGDARILEILPDGVRYERGGKEFISHIAALAAKVRTPTATLAIQTKTAETKKDSP